MGTKLNAGSMEDVMVQAFCNDVYTELEGMRLKLLAVTDELELAYGEEHHPFAAYKRHLMELSDQIEWKLQILSHACPYDWKGNSSNVETIVSVQQPEISAGLDLSGGYAGG